MELYELWWQNYLYKNELLDTKVRINYELEILMFNSWNLKDSFQRLLTRLGYPRYLYWCNFATKIKQMVPVMWPCDIDKHSLRTKKQFLRDQIRFNWMEREEQRRRYWE